LDLQWHILIKNNYTFPLLKFHDPGNRAAVAQHYLEFIINEEKINAEEYKQEFLRAHF